MVHRYVAEHNLDTTVVKAETERRTYYCNLEITFISKIGSDNHGELPAQRLRQQV